MTVSCDWNSAWQTIQKSVTWKFQLIYLLLLSKEKTLYAAEKQYMKRTAYDLLV